MDNKSADGSERAAAEEERLHDPHWVRIARERIRAGSPVKAGSDLYVLEMALSYYRGTLVALTERDATIRDQQAEIERLRAELAGTVACLESISQGASPPSAPANVGERFGEPVPRNFTEERPGPGWKISDETQRELERMENAQRRGAANAGGQPEAGGWQPISVPITGAPLDVWLATDDGVTLVRVEEELPAGGYHESVTHWMPAHVPAPPAPAEDAGAVTDDESFQCPACHWHQGHDPDEWFAAEVRIRNRRAEDAGAGGDARCADCRRPYGDEHGFPDLVISHDAWAKITHDRDGLLCPSCLCARAHGAGLSNVPAIFTSGPFCAPNTDALDDLVNNPPPPSAALTRLLRDPPPWDSAPSADADALALARDIVRGPWTDTDPDGLGYTDDPPLLVDLIATALVAHGRAAAERMRERAAQWHDGGADFWAARGDEREAAIHRDSAIRMRALPLDPKEPTP